METLIFVPELNAAIETAKNECNNQYALTYLHAIPQAISECSMLQASPEHAIRIQLLYILSNMKYWKGDIAKNTKAILKKYSKKDTRLFMAGTNILNN